MNHHHPKTQGRSVLVPVIYMLGVDFKFFAPLGPEVAKPTPPILVTLSKQILSVSMFATDVNRNILFERLRCIERRRHAKGACTLILLTQMVISN